jgi:polar amino acid transport system substrate-binding protein
LLLRNAGECSQALLAHLPPPLRQRQPLGCLRSRFVSLGVKAMMCLARYAAFLVLICLPLRTASSATLEEIKKRGAIYIAVKTDYKPWGFIDEWGNLKGMEIDLALDVAKRLQVRPVFVPAVATTRVQLLNEGKADIVIATFSVTEERKKQVTFIAPGYYAAMTAILSREKHGAPSNLSSSEERRTCVIAGSYGNTALAGPVGGSLIESATLGQAENKLLAGECDGVAFDDVVLLYQIKSEPAKWQDYDISLVLGIKPAPWAIAIPLSGNGGALAEFLSKTVSDWHREGTLLRLEKKWVGENSMALRWLSTKVASAR